MDRRKKEKKKRKKQHGAQKRNEQEKNGKKKHCMISYSHTAFKLQLAIIHLPINTLTYF